MPATVPAEVQSRSPTARQSDAEAETPPAHELLSLLGDEYTRAVLAAVSEKPRGGRAVAEAADVSRPTAYRRLNELQAAGLVETELEIDADGHHRERFEAVVDRVDIEFDAETIRVSINDGPA